MSIMWIFQARDIRGRPLPLPSKSLPLWERLWPPLVPGSCSCLLPVFSPAPWSLSLFLRSCSQSHRQSQGSGGAAQRPQTGGVAHGSSSRLLKKSRKEKDDKARNEGEGRGSMRMQMQKMCQRAGVRGALRGRYRVPLQLLPAAASVGRLQRPGRRGSARRRPKKETETRNQQNLAALRRGSCRAMQQKN